MSAVLLLLPFRVLVRRLLLDAVGQLIAAVGRGVELAGSAVGAARVQQAREDVDLTVTPVEKKSFLSFLCKSKNIMLTCTLA